MTGISVTDAPATPGPRLIMMCGVPFAGKTTLARAIADRLGFALLEVDQINRERGLGGDGRRLTRQEWAGAYREAYRRLAAHLAEGRSVVYDATSFRRLQRDQLRRVAAPYRARPLVVWVDPPLSEVAHRRHANLERPSRVDVHDADFDEVVATFQPPAMDEAMLCYDTSASPADWVERHRGSLR